MDDKNVVKKRVTLAIAFAVFLLAVIVIIVLIKPVIFKVKDNNRAEVSEQTQKEAEEYLKVYYRSLVIDKCEMSVEEYEPETNSEYISYVKAGDEGVFICILCILWYNGYTRCERRQRHNLYVGQCEVAILLN